MEILETFIGQEMAVNEEFSLPRLQETIGLSNVHSSQIADTTGSIVHHIDGQE